MVNRAKNPFEDMEISNKTKIKENEYFRLLYFDKKLYILIYCTDNYQNVDPETEVIGNEININSINDLKNCTKPNNNLIPSIKTEIENTKGFKINDDIIINCINSLLENKEAKASNLKLNEFTNKLSIAESKSSIYKHIVKLNENKKHEKHLKISDDEEKIISQVQKNIEEYGGVMPYLDYIFKKIKLGNNKNLHRKICNCFGINIGFKSVIIESGGATGEGKSYEDEFLLKIIPTELLLKYDKITPSAFMREGVNNGFSRKILYMGDKGGKNDFENNRELLDIAKSLATENTYTYVKSDNDTAKENINLTVEVESFGIISQTIDTEQENDYMSQIKSRTLKFKSPFIDPKEKATFYSKTHNKACKEYREYQKGLRLLNDFSLWYKSKCNTKIKPEQINTINVIDLMQDYLKDIDLEIRAYISLELDFKIYAILNDYKFKKEGDLITLTPESWEDFKSECLPKSPINPEIIAFLKRLHTKIEVIPEEKKDLTINFKAYYKDPYNENLEEYTPLNQLDERTQKKYISKLWNEYRFDKEGNEEKYFFTIGSLKRNNTFGRAKEITTKTDLSIFVSKLAQEGYIGKWDYKYRNNNIYYLNSRTKDILNK